MEKPFSVAMSAVLIDTEGDFVAACDGIELMSVLASMEIDLAVIFAVPEVHRDPIRIAFIPENGKDPTGLAAQDFKALGFRKLLIPSLDVSEHYVTSRLIRYAQLYTIGADL